MSTERETTRIVRSWLEEGVTRLPDRVLDIVLDQVPATPQRRSWWPSRRFAQMNKLVPAAVAAAAVLVVAVVGYNLLAGVSEPGAPTTGPTAQPTVVPTVVPSPSPAVTPGLKTVTITPYVGDDPSDDDSIAFTVQYPEGWVVEQFDREEYLILSGSVGADGMASLTFALGLGLYSDPCRPTDGTEGQGDPPDIPVGPTVAEFVTALDTHPLLDVTTPVDVTLGGYSGKYLELQVPADISGCVRYRPIGGDTVYAQGPAMRYRFWALDVDGIRIVITGYDFPGTSAQHRAELQAMVDSIQITR
jgi:hypothetical protein